MRKLLYIDSSYTLSQIRARGLDHVLRIRFLDGYFDQVWSAHPVDTHPASTSDIVPWGKPLEVQLTPNHVFVRGRYGRFPALARLAPVNALLSLVWFIGTSISLVRREKISIIRTGDPLLCGLIGLIVARVTGAKLVVRINADNDMNRSITGEPMNPRLFRVAAVEDRVERLVLKRADCVLVPSRNYGDFAVRKGAAPDRIRVVRYGNLIDRCHLVKPSERAAPNDAALVAKLRERPWMVHVGRLQKIKYAEDCYEVLRQLAGQGQDTGLVLIGDGPLRDTIGRRAEEDGLTERVLFLGNIDQSVLAQILPECAIVLSPLTGRALAETAFAELPIIAYDLDWQGEVVENDVTGILVTARDVTGMAEGAACLLADPVLRRELGAAVRKRAFALLDPEQQTRCEIEAYESLELLK